MARIKLDLPDKFIFSYQYEVRISDVNYGGHVGNDAMLTIMQEGRMKLINAIGFKDELSIAEGIGLIVADAAVVYKSEGFYGDTLEISIAVDDFNKYGFDFYYQLTNVDSGAEVARGKTGIVCFYYKEKKLAVVPKELLERLSGL